MRDIAALDSKDRADLFRDTASKKKLHITIVEKDFWVCFMLDYLFHDCPYKDAFVFKGGTSLSKSYHVIQRFSEDIDLILDWREIIEDETDPWEDRSKTQQDKFDKQLNEKAAQFLAEQLVPALNKDLSLILGEGYWCSVDEKDNMVINFAYPQIQENVPNYLLPYVRLEIGPLAEWTPSHQRVITSFAAEEYPHLFHHAETSVLTVDAERTFWEKAIILHKIANTPEGKRIQPRCARHMYDVFCIGHSSIKQDAFNNKDLLKQDANFKQKFYYSKSAHYENATLKGIAIVPPSRLLAELKADYLAMGPMIYGNKPEFKELLTYLQELQEEIHSLA